MTAAELAAYLKCHVSTVYRLLKRGELPAFRVGDEWRFRTSAINDWMMKRSSARKQF